MANEKLIKKLENVRWDSSPGLAYDTYLPAIFTAEVPRKSNLETLCQEVARAITETGHPNCKPDFFGSDSKISDQAFEYSTGVFSFVLLDEQLLVGGMGWHEAVYAVRVKGTALEGWCITWGSNSCVAGRHTYPRGHYRFLVNSVRSGVVTFSKKAVSDKEFRHCRYTVTSPSVSDEQIKDLDLPVLEDQFSSAIVRARGLRMFSLAIFLQAIEVTQKANELEIAGLIQKALMVNDAYAWSWWSFGEGERSVLCDVVEYYLSHTEMQRAKRKELHEKFYSLIKEGIIKDR